MVDDARLHVWIYHLIWVMFLLRVEGLYVDITYVQSAVAKGAVCLDGSPPAYHLSRGFGSGAGNWLVHIEGGGWCNNVTTCLARKYTHLGSSSQMVKLIAFSGILSNNRTDNPDGKLFCVELSSCNTSWFNCHIPDFYNWNKVKIRYCDGSSFTGDVGIVDPTTNLHYRGARVWLAVMEDLLEKGMRNAENALLSGCSAGGLASILHCDSFRALLPMGTKVKCLSDAGFFINAKDISGMEHIKAYFNDVVTTHGSAKSLPLSCTSRLIPPMCFFPQYVAQRTLTPLFILNAAYDSWQIKNILVPGVADPHGTWRECKLDIKQCSSTQIRIMQGFRTELLSALAGLGNSPSRGWFINSCYVHCQTEMQETWLTSDSPTLGKIPIAKAVGDWFYDRSAYQKIDCPYPCDSTCPNRILEGS